MSSAKSLEKESPDHHFGPVALAWLKAVRRVARKAAAQRKAADAQAKAQAAFEDKKQTLEAAKKAMVSRATPGRLLLLGMHYSATHGDMCAQPGQTTLPCLAPSPSVST